MADTSRQDSVLRRQITLAILVTISIVALLLTHVGPFAMDVFGQGLAVRGLLPPVCVLIPLWLIGMARPRWIWNGRFAAAVALPAAAQVAYWHFTAPEPGPVQNPALHAREATGSLKDYNLIIISLDTLRADRLGAYGYKRPTSPALDQLAAQSVLFENAFSQAPATLISHATAMTGLFPGAHGAQLMTYSGLPDTAVTLAEILRGRGYATAGFTGGAQISRNFGMAQGFDVYQDKNESLARNWPAARLWLDANRDKKFFLFLHAYDVHTPYAAPAPYNRMFDPDYRGGLPDAITNDLVKKINAGVVPVTSRDIRFVNAQYDAGVRYVDAYIAQET